MADPTAPHELTFGERATWGECPVCHAEHGEGCMDNVPLSAPVENGVRPGLYQFGAHLGRLQRAPMRVRTVVCE